MQGDGTTDSAITPPAHDSRTDPQPEQRTAKWEASTTFGYSGVAIALPSCRFAASSRRVGVQTVAQALGVLLHSRV